MNYTPTILLGIMAFAFDTMKAKMITAFPMANVNPCALLQKLNFLKTIFTTTGGRKFPNYFLI